MFQEVKALFKISIFLDVSFLNVDVVFLREKRNKLLVSIILFKNKIIIKYEVIRFRTQDLKYQQLNFLPFALKTVDLNIALARNGTSKYSFLFPKIARLHVYMSMHIPVKFVWQ